MPNKDSKIKVGILGCTGAVGQKLVALLADHPFFEISALAASEYSAGKLYKDAVNWKEQISIPEHIKNIKVTRCDEKFDCRILFSGLDSSVAGKYESENASAGYIVVSNSKNHRMNDDVPLVIPEVNPEHFDLIEIQKKKIKNGGFIVTNPNCSTIILAIALSTINKKFGLKKVIVTTMQAISGAGYPGISSLDIMGNLIPYISDEEEKIETELLKIFGSFENGKITPAEIIVSAVCNRVDVKDGHTLSISIETDKKAEKDELIKSFDSINNLSKLNLSPEKVIKYFDDPKRPQPLYDLYINNGMTVSIGNIRKCNVLDWKFTALGHNTIRGAAGAAILNAEWLLKNEYID